MPEPVPIAPLAAPPGAPNDRECRAALDKAERTIGHASWRLHPGLVHGTTLRETLPEPGKPDFFTALRRAREREIFPTVLTFGADQVHGASIASIRRPMTEADHPEGFRFDPELNAGEFPKCDGLVTSLPGVLLVIQTADCLPVFYHDPIRRVVGLAHCGWRGLYAGLAGAMITELERAGAGVETLQIWLGPGICAARYEVGPELVEKFSVAFPDAPVSPDGAHLDLAAIARWQVENAGVPSGAIIDSNECTLNRPDRYHSYRAQADSAGRMLSFIGFGLHTHGAWD